LRGDSLAIMERKGISSRSLRDFGVQVPDCLIWLSACVLFCITLVPCNLAAQTWKSGQDSPVHDSDRLLSLSGKTISIEDDDVRLSVDERSGALLEFLFKKTGWNLLLKRELADSFRLFAPTASRSYSPVLGARNMAASITKSADGKSLTIVWRDLESEYLGKLDTVLTGKITLQGAEASFDMEVDNHSKYSIATVEWPIIGALSRPRSSDTLKRLNFSYGTGLETNLYPHFQNDHGYYGTSYPMQMSAGRYTMVLGKDEGLYIGTHDTSSNEITRYLFELKPGYSGAFEDWVPRSAEISGHPVRISAAIEHYPFAAPGETFTLATIVLSPFQGDWHHGADVYRKWHDTWFRRPITPDWAQGVHSWQQIQINSAEDDLRTPYRDLPKRAQEAARNGISAIQLVGWNDGGQDRGNPSHDTDPRLGSYQDLKDAIAKIETMGVHVILFNKYTWADVTTPRYKTELYKHMAVDPNDATYIYHGYQYQTPEQLADINTRRLAVACLNDRYWLDLSAKEFRKSIDLGASGILYDEVQHHGGADYCFSPNHGHRVPVTLWSGDEKLGNMFRDIARGSVGENHFLMAGEAAYDLETRNYSLIYFRITPSHIPLDRYDDPFLPIMIALTGFDDREMINQALRYRYILSYEPFNFKGNLDDFPLTLAYGKKIDSLRKQYHDYLWDAEFRDDQDATVTVNGQNYPDYSVFRRQDGKRAVIVVNTTTSSFTAHVTFPHGTGLLSWASPEVPTLHRSTGTIQVPFRSAVVLMER
jgi:uncharacterized protein DUF6259